MTSSRVLLPVTLEQRKDNLFVVCFCCPRQYLREPFFIDSIAQRFDFVKDQIKLPEEEELLARPVHYDSTNKNIVIVPVEDFIVDNQGINNKTSLKFIFHMSRCGSTLGSQMLAQNDKLFVLSEPTVMNAVLDPKLSITEETRGRLLTAVISSLSSCSPQKCEHTVIKFRSWNILYLDFILRQYPSVPWLYFHRNGLEVLASILDKPPGWLRSRFLYSDFFSKALNVDQYETEKMEESEYIARMLGFFCEKAMVHPERREFVAYEKFKDDFLSAITYHWNLELSDQEVNDMLKRSDTYSKGMSDENKFISDSESKRASATAEQRKLIYQYVESIREQL